MNIQIIEDQVDEVQFQLDDKGVKLLSLMLIEASNFYRPFFRSLSINIQKGKIIPFFLENFVKFLEGKQFFVQQKYMEDILKIRKGLKYRCQDLAKIFMSSENIEIQLKWFDYLEGFAAIDIQRKISSKKVQNLYLQNLQCLQQQVNYPRPYYCFINSDKMYIPHENDVEFYNPPLCLMDRSQIELNRLFIKKKMIIK